MTRSYTELNKLSSFEERFDYLNLSGIVGESTFGYDRYINQMLYTSQEWRRVRDRVIVRDLGCDLGVDGRDIPGNIIVHHMNPITVEDIQSRSPMVFSMEYLICTSLNTHNAIHFSGKDSLDNVDFIKRKKNDTCPWR